MRGWREPSASAWAAAGVPDERERGRGRPRARPTCTPGRRGRGREWTRYKTAAPRRAGDAWPGLAPGSDLTSPNGEGASSPVGGERGEGADEAGWTPDSCP